MVCIGSRAGEEIVQLYLSHPDMRSAPLHALAGFQRVHLQAGESKWVSFVITPRQMSLVDEEGRRAVMPERMVLYAGGGQPGYAPTLEDSITITGELPLPRGGAVGIDLGVVRFATLSDGTFYTPLNSFKRHAAALRKGQQAMCRKQKFSNNWKKAKARIRRIHARVGNARRDYLHKISTAISQNHAMVCIEDLQVQNMSKSAAGSSETPGRQVRAKAGLNKSILDQGWFEFRRQLEYKLSWNGGELILVPPRDTSRRCPECNCVSAQNRQTQERFACIECGFEEHADRVGAINILRAGHARCACEVSDADRQQQEPAEAIQGLLNAA
jgi:IS605 OrfB family transposase